VVASGTDSWSAVNGGKYKGNNPMPTIPEEIAEVLRRSYSTTDHMRIADYITGLLTRLQDREDDIKELTGQRAHGPEDFAINWTTYDGASYICYFSQWMQLHVRYMEGEDDGWYWWETDIDGNHISDFIGPFSSAAAAKADCESAHRQATDR
jgi:hypothetical protein